MQISRTRLSPISSGLRTRSVVTTSRYAEEFERIVQVILRIFLEASATFSCSLHQPVPQTPIDVLPDEVIGLHDRTLVEVAAPATKKATDDDDSVLRCVRVPLWRRAFVDSSEQSHDRFLGRTRADEGLSILSVEPPDRVA